ncbi:MAG TPA: peptidoglycan editing factor PgeF, partial [Bacteroidota bacterium]|nr:peptidoglycan editing factor PgeF [Bacteroidota bacterium]
IKPPNYCRVFVNFISDKINSTLLSSFPELVSGISSRNGGASPEPFGMNMSYNVGDDPKRVGENRNRFFSSLGIDEADVAFTRQVHGDKIIYADRPGSFGECDALYTDRPGVHLAISIADCIPILLFAPRQRFVAAVHSGWRGSELRILSKTIEMATNRFGSSPQEIVAYIGPAAGGCCYEVGEEVAKRFPSSCVLRNNYAKPHLDLKEFNRQLLLEAGIQEKNIDVAAECTICSPQMLHSYRRDNDRSGRMLAIIGMAPEKP